MYIFLTNACREREGYSNAERADVKCR